jgi:hypothetical protein
MKLSQKLLALSGVAFADYACCPYDDYGIPDVECLISEKTPFDALDTWNGHSCKAWEANVDASFDGNDNDCNTGDDNWSSCGFQRHFSWIAQNNIDDHQPQGAFKLFLTGDDRGAFGTPAELDMNQGGADGYTVGGSPWLNGVCKLFIPVPRTHIASVSVAGVHISGLGWSAYDANVQDNAGTDYQIDGSAYCFSVVNPSEFLSNYNGADDKYLSNGNVAGFRSSAAEGDLNNLANDPFDDLTSETARQAGVAHVVYGGPSAAGQATYESILGTSADATGIVLDGANFDVVAHFKHSFCVANTHNNWDSEEMQMAGDWGNQDPEGVDYPDGTDPLNLSHTHTDTTDKRFVSPLNMVEFNSFYPSDGTTMTAPVDTTNQVRWPNVGAYAGFYSFVACATADATDFEHTDAGLKKFVYLAGIDTGAAGCTVGDTSGCHDIAGVNKLVSSVGNSMWRYECENDGGFFAPEMRFNIRQAGSNIRNCGPGTMPDSEDVRCSWNWNFVGFTDDDSSNTRPQAYFMRSNPKSFEVWDVNGVNGEQEGAIAWANPTALTQTKVITVKVNNRAESLGGAESALTMTNDIPSKYVDTPTVSGNTYTFNLLCVNIGTTRDAFPDCYQGEEIHLSATVTYPENYAGDWTDVMADPWLTEATMV